MFHTIVSSRYPRVLLTCTLLASSACAVPAGEEDPSEDDSKEVTTATTSEPITGAVTPATAYPETVLIQAYRYTGKLDAYGSPLCGARQPGTPCTGTPVLRCTGVLMTPTTVLTAGHCLDIAGGLVFWDVTAPWIGQTARTALDAGYWSPYTKNATGGLNTNLVDIGALFLSSPLYVGQYPTLSTAIVANDTKVQGVGRFNNGSDAANLTWLGHQFGVRDTAGTDLAAFKFDYYSTSAKTQPEQGDSGGPIFRTGTHEILGFTSGVGTASASFPAASVYTRADRPEVRTAMSKSIYAFGAWLDRGRTVRPPRWRDPRRPLAGPRPIPRRAETSRAPEKSRDPGESREMGKGPRSTLPPPLVGVTPDRQGGASLGRDLSARQTASDCARALTISRTRLCIRSALALMQAQP